MVDNMGLVNIDSSDYVSPTDINNNFKKLDVLGLDYVTESGKSGEWWYRKWKSGRAECGIDYKVFGNKSLTDLYTSFLFRTSDMTFGAYPFSFSSRPYVSVSFAGDTNSTRGAFPVLRHTTSTTTSPTFFMVAFNDSSDMNVSASIFVSGSFK